MVLDGNTRGGAGGLVLVVELVVVLAVVYIVKTVGIN